MKNITVYKEQKHCAIIEQISVQRTWMDDTSHKHAYQCMPMALANTLGWGISFPEDISFSWDGVSDTSDHHVTIMSGYRYCSTSRANATISFNTYLNVKTDENTTMLVMPVPNELNTDVQCLSALISTSFYQSAIPIAWKILTPNKKIIVPAKTPVAVILPISLTELNNSEIHLKDVSALGTQKLISKIRDTQKNLEYIKKQLEMPRFGHLYKKAENYKGESVGKHEVKKITLRTIND
jgi:hypothetical protein